MVTVVATGESSIFFPRDMVEPQSISRTDNPSYQRASISPHLIIPVSNITVPILLLKNVKL